MGRRIPEFPASPCFLEGWGSRCGDVKSGGQGQGSHAKSQAKDWGHSTCKGPVARMGGWQERLQPVQLRDGGKLKTAGEQADQGKDQTFHSVTGEKLLEGLSRGAGDPVWRSALAAEWQRTGGREQADQPGRDGGGEMPWWPGR